MSTHLRKPGGVRETVSISSQRDYLTLIPARILEAIGAVAVNFAQLEDSLARAIGYLLTSCGEGLQLYHQAVTAELSFRQRVWIFVNVYRERHGQAPILDSLKKRCFQFEESRNAIIHSIWQTCILSGRKWLFA